VVERTSRAFKAATFLTQALNLADDPAALVTDLDPVADAPLVAIFAAEFESSIGPAAFLVYVYDLHAVDDATSGRDRFAADVETLQEADRRGAPGPRLVASASTETDAFVLATTPSTRRALAGQTNEPSPGETPPVARDAERQRREAAAELLRLLRAANTEAATWLAARSASVSPPSSEETELALFLYEEGSLNDLLVVLREFATRAASSPADPAADR
jgi:hypothetical protein